MRSSDGVRNVSAAIPSAQNVCIQGYKGGTDPPELERCPNICGRLIHGSFRVNIGIARMTEMGRIADRQLRAPISAIGARSEAVSKRTPDRTTQGSLRICKGPLMCWVVACYRLFTEGGAVPALG